MAAAPKGSVSRRWMIWTSVTAGLWMVTLWAIFVVAPVEEQMGVVQKIFYFHVPSAYAMYVGFVVSGFASGMYLRTGKSRWDGLALAGAEVGVLFCVVVLITGPMWARKAWGVWWTWDPRLLTTLLAGMVYVAYLSVRSFGSTGTAEKRFAAGLSVLGVLDLPIIHYSVKRWRGQHPTVITNQGGGLDSDMYFALGIACIAFTSLVLLLLWTRSSIEALRHRVNELEFEAAERGVLKDERWA